MYNLHKCFIGKFSRYRYKLFNSSKEREKLYMLIWQLVQPP